MKASGSPDIIINFINSSYAVIGSNNPGIAVQSLSWTYWPFNGEDSFGILSSNYYALALPVKEYSLLCFDQQAH